MEMSTYHEYVRSKDGAMIRQLPLILLLPALLVLVVWFDEPAPRSDFTWSSSSDVFTLDPQRMSYLTDMRVGSALYEGLVRFDPEQGLFVPGAATSWERSADGRSWTFHLRPDARWSDGSPVTAWDFAWSWMRLLTPDTAASYSSLFFPIRGARECWKHRNEQLKAFSERDFLDDRERIVAARRLWDDHEDRFSREVGIEVVDESTLVVHLEQPLPWLLDLLAFTPASPVYRPSVEGWPTADDPDQPWHRRDIPEWDDRAFVKIDPASGRLFQDHRWARPGRLVGNGPYLLDSWRYKRDLRLVASPTWHDADGVACETITKRTIEDPNTAVLAFESGALDWLNGVNVDYRVDMIEQQDLGHRNDIHVVPAFATDFFSFNCRPTLPGGRLNPFADPAVRRAFALTVDRDSIVEHVTRLNEPIATTLVPPGSIPGYESPRGLDRDPDRARSELAAAGWIDRDGDGLVESEDGSLFPITTLLYTTNTPRFKRMAIALREQWETELGVRIELVGKGSKFYRNDLREGDFMIARGTWYGDYGDPTTFLDLCRTGDGNNSRGFTDPMIDAALDEASTESDPSRRLKMLADVERRLFTESLPMVPICQVVDVHMFDPDRISGLSSHPRQIHQFWKVAVDDGGARGAAAP
ncbi:MAG: hypothetical protein CMJ24_10485 [Phycisphaerae bacterium]|nr:hypothetical protein [Phycisphaerae bacterium]|tara:strand:+ start:575 stop:2500 length:1926 start_codon:yes stop_codon:yes gene_type:complete